MDHQQCPLCLTKGKTALLQWQSLDFERKILLCLSPECTFPFGTKFFDDCLRQKTNDFQFKTNQRLWQRESLPVFVSEDKAFIDAVTPDTERKTPSDASVVKESNITDITASENYSSLAIEKRNEDSTKEIYNIKTKNINNLKQVSTCNHSIALINTSSSGEFKTSDLCDLESPDNVTDVQRNEKANPSEFINCNKNTSSSNDLQTVAKIVNYQVSPDNHHNHRSIHCSEAGKQDLKLNPLVSIFTGNSATNRSASQSDNKIDAVIEKEKRKSQKIPNSTIKYKPYDVGASSKQYKKTADSDNRKKGSSLLQILDRNPLARMSRGNINLNDLPEKMLNEVLKEKFIQDRSRQDKLSPKTSASDGNTNHSNLILHTRCDMDDITYSTSQASPADSGFSSIPDSSANTPPIVNGSNNLITANSQFLEELDALIPDITEEASPISNIG